MVRLFLLAMATWCLASAEEEEKSGALSKEYHEAQAEKQIKKLMEFDDDEDGKLSHKEVLQDPVIDTVDIMKISKYMNKLKENFEKHDADGDGLLDENELPNYVRDKIEL